MSLTGILTFIFLNSTILLSSAIILIALNKYKLPPPSKLILGIFTLYFSQILITTFVLGSFAAISYFNLSLLNYSIFALTLILFGKKTINNLKKETSIKKSFPIFAVSAIFGPIVATIIFSLLNSMLSAPMEYDSVAYHLPFIVEWLNSGNLFKLYYSAFASPISYYPSNFEIINLWTFLPSHGDLLANLINYLILVIFGLTIYKICRNFKIPTKTALLSTALLIYMPVFLNQLGTPLVDLFFSLTFALSIYFLQESIIKRQENNLLDPILFGLSLGMFVGTKYLGLIYCIIPAIIFIFTIKNLKKISLALISGLLTGAFFYIRNWLESGNPVFPIDVSIFGIKLFSGFRGLNEKIASTSIWENLSKPDMFKNLLASFHAMTGLELGLMVGATTISIFFAIYQIIKHKKFTTEAKISLLLTASSLVYFFLYLKAPYGNSVLTANIRYSMIFLIIGCVNIGYIVSKIKSLKSWFYLSSILLISYNLLHLINFYPEKLDFAPSYKISLILLATSFLLLLAPLFLQISNKKLAITTKISSIIISIIIFSQILHFTSLEREKLVPTLFKNSYQDSPGLSNLLAATLWLNESAPTAKIAYAGFNFHYHLFGRQLQREVDYININDCSNCRYFEYKDSPDGIRRNPDYKIWLNNLKAKNKEYLVIEPTMTVNVKITELDWATQHPEKFKKVFNKGDSYIYKIQ